ncbi:MAG TPA: hypothetical protein VGZ02_14555 [Candidatus Baltobacteraceae bacterium]|nr:hypothetical protein [Candidatus Baltobacteraceae bacterium]
MFAGVLLTSVSPAVAAHFPSGQVAPQVSEGLDDLNRFYQTQSTKQLESAVEAVFNGAGQTLAHASPTDYVTDRRKIVSAWVQVFIAIQHYYDPAYDTNNPHLRYTTCVTPPDSGVPCGVDPSALKDPKLKAQYAAAVAANNEKARRWDFQTRLRMSKQAALTDFGLTLESFDRNHALPDRQALRDIITRSRLNATTQTQLEAML